MGVIFCESSDRLKVPKSTKDRSFLPGIYSPSQEMTPTGRKQDSLLRIYLSAHEKEVVSTRMALFDQEKAVEQFGIAAA